MSKDEADKLVAQLEGIQQEIWDLGIPWYPADRLNDRLYRLQQSIHEMIIPCAAPEPLSQEASCPLTTG
jgi:hypothetical protein